MLKSHNAFAEWLALLQRHIPPACRRLVRHQKRMLYGVVFLMAACSPEKPLPKAVCDLTASPCVLSIKDQSLQAANPDEPWLLRLTHEPIAGDSHEVRLQLTVNGRLDRVSTIMQGESMYMGEYPILFQLVSAQTQPQVWQAVFRMPVCTSHAMLWRIRLAISHAQQHDTADILFQE